MRKAYLICNAHLDPVWQWSWEEGAAEAVPTFRVACEFCEKYEGFVFNHNEVILYEWVEEYEPQLFARIQKLVKEGKWHIFGGWYIQPDCTMPSGESIVRQILTGRKYFQEKFGVSPTTAMNVDPFGHSRGLVQILNKSGFDSYVIMRPTNMTPGDFIWTGYDDSSVLVHKTYGGYNSLKGKSAEKIKDLLEKHPDEKDIMIYWGIGNHGGGPSEVDLNSINELQKQLNDVELIHTVPEDYFKTVDRSKLPTINNSLVHTMVGCYTSMYKVKSMHAKLENQLFMTEKMASAASLSGLMEYPTEDFASVTRDLLFSEFHDILPGSSVKVAEEDCLRLMSHGLEKLSRIRAKAFFALSSGQPRPQNGEIPILVYNPHPYEVDTVVECEFQLEDQNYAMDEITIARVYNNGVEVSAQLEKEAGSLNLDWRKKIVFNARLKPSQMNRFDCRLEKVVSQVDRLNKYLTYGDVYKKKLFDETGTHICLKTGVVEIAISKNTGLMDTYIVNGVNYLEQNSFSADVYFSGSDPWGMNDSCYPKKLGSFKLMSDNDARKFSNIEDNSVGAIRIIEQGDTRILVQAIFEYKSSFMIMDYKLPVSGTEIECDIRMLWNEKDSMVKLSFKSAFKNSVAMGQQMFGREVLSNDGNEFVSQRWSAVVSENKDVLAIYKNGLYGGSFKDGEYMLNLLHSPGYTAHPIETRLIIPKDREVERIDLGEHTFSIKICGGDKKLLGELDKNSQIFNEKPFALSFFTGGNGIKPQPALIISNCEIVMSAFCIANNGSDYIIRLYETAGRENTTEIYLFGITKTISFGKCEIVTLRYNVTKNTLEKCSIDEK